MDPDNENRYLGIIESERRAKTLRAKVDPLELGLSTMIRAAVILAGISFLGGVLFVKMFG